MFNIHILINNYYKNYQSYFKNAFIYLFASIFTSAIRVLINPVMAKNLTYEDYAIIGYFNSFSTLFLPILNFSIISY